MSNCVSDTLVIPEGMHALVVVQDSFAILQCEPTHQYPTASDGIYWCEDNQWVGDIPDCIPRPLSSTTAQTIPTTTSIKQPTTTTTLSDKQPTTTTTTTRIADESGCTLEDVYMPSGTEMLYLKEDEFAILQCIANYKFPSAHDGMYRCKEGNWIGTVPDCIPKPDTVTKFPSVHEESSTPELCASCSTQTVPVTSSTLEGMSKVFLGLGFGIFAVMILIVLLCLCHWLGKKKNPAYSNTSLKNFLKGELRRQERFDFEHRKSLGGDSVGSGNVIWTADLDSIYRPGTFSTINTPSNTYLSAEPHKETKLSKKDYTVDISDTRQLLSRKYSSSGSSTDSSQQSSSTTPSSDTQSRSASSDSTYQQIPDNISDQSVNNKKGNYENPSYKHDTDTNGEYEMDNSSSNDPSKRTTNRVRFADQNPPPLPDNHPSFFGSAVSLGSLYKDGSIKDAFVSVKPSTYIPHAVVDSPTTRQSSIGHCI